MPRYIIETPEALTSVQTERINAALAMDGYGATVQPEARKLKIIGRLWFQKSYGNTYHTAEVFIDGVSVWKSGKQYGYGSQYMTTAADWLVANGYLPKREHPAGGNHWSSTYALREESGYTFTYEEHDVTRQRDL